MQEILHYGQVLAAGAESILIPEEDYDIDDIIERIEQWCCTWQKT